MPKTHALIVAAGQGKRFGADKNKVWHSVGGNPVLYYSTQVFQACSEVSSITLVCHADEWHEMELFKNQYQFSKVDTVVIGDNTRQKSVYNGLLKMKDLINENDYILVHNGANPLLLASELEKLILKQQQYHNVALGRPIQKSVKQVNDNGIIVGHLNRKDLWELETPQGGRYKDLFEAHTQAKIDGYEASDETELLLRSGHQIHIIECSKENFKITTPVDAMILEQILTHH